jgi:peptidoglycan hydrolase-like protein with peptidoglycan-binding domain
MNLDNWSRRAVAFAAAAVFAGTASVIAVPGTATAAALPTCTSWTTYARQFLYAEPTLYRNDGNHNCTLSYGAQGAAPAIFVLQGALRECYGQNIAQDAVFGPATRQAVMNVQAFTGLRPDGVYGPALHDRMVFPPSSAPDFVHCWFEA